MPALTPAPEGSESLAALAEGAQTLSPLVERSESLSPLAEQDNVTVSYPGLYPSAHTFPSARTFPSPGLVIPGVGPLLAGLVEGSLTLAILQET